jgi:hypothetical protein
MPRFTPEYWHARAEEARTIAEGIRDGEARRIMHRIAGGYDHMAQVSQRLTQSERFLENAKARSKHASDRPARRASPKAPRSH